MPGRLLSGFVMPMPNSVSLVWDSTGVLSWMPMYSQIHWNTGDLSVWFSSGIYRSGICPSRGIPGLTFALERPGASGDQGTYANRIELSGIKARFPMPDLSAEYRYGGKFGYVELAGILRYISWEDTQADAYDLSDKTVGWGLNLSSNINITKSLVGRFQVVYGEGIENYMNDAPADIGIKENFSDPTETNSRCSTAGIWNCCLF